MARTLRHSTDYRRHRAVGYPAFGDALDAVMKGFKALSEQGFVLPAETLAWIERCEAVKARFKKPTP